MIKEDISQLFQEATRLEKKGDYPKAITMYKMILSVEPNNRRALFKQFKVAIESRANDLNHMLFERLIMLDDLTIEERIIISNYYINILKAYSLAEVTLKEILSTNPQNKAAGEAIAQVYLLIDKKDAVLETYEHLKETHGEKVDYAYNLIDVLLKDEETLVEVIPLAKEILENKKEDIFAMVILEYVYTKLDMETEKDEISTEISKYIFGAEDRVAAIKTILKYRKVLSKGKRIFEIYKTNYIKVFECKKGKFKNKKETKRIKGTLQNKLTANLAIQTNGFFVYSISYPGSGSINKSGKIQTLEYITVIAFNTPKNIIEIYPSTKVEKEK